MSPATESLEPLVERARAGDSSAFDALVVRFQDMAFAVALAYLGETEAARDASQDAFIEAHRTLARLRVPRAFPAWLKRIVRKHCDRQTRVASPPLVPLDPRHPLAAPLATQREGPPQRGDLAAALAVVPIGLRLVLTMHYLAGTPLREIAATLGIPSAAAKKRLHDARLRLKEGLAMIAPDRCRLPSADAAFSSTVSLFLAVRAGDRAAVGALLDEHPQLVNAVERWDSEHALRRVLPFATGQTPLVRAVQGGDRAMVELLLARGADPSGSCGCHNAETALHIAALAGDAALARILIAAGAPLNARAFRGFAPLHLAAMRGQREVARLLLAAGAETGAVDDGGNTALRWATIKDHAALVGLLRDGSTRDDDVDARVATCEATQAPHAADGALVVLVPVGDGLVGRRVDGLGEAIDGGEPPPGPPAALAEPATKAPKRAFAALATGIKTIDLLAPLPRGGRIDFTGGFGCGRFVVLAELIHRFAIQLHGRVVWLGWEQRAFDLDENVGELREFSLHDHVCMVWHRRSDPPLRGRLAGRTAATIARAFRDEGREVLLIIEGPAQRRREVAEAAACAGVESGGAITALLVQPPDAPRPQPRLPRDRDARIALDRELVVRGLLPAISTGLTRSRLSVSKTSAIAERVRRLLAQEGLDGGDAAAATPRAVRAKLLRAYLTQAFHVTDFFVGTPGVSTAVERVAATCERILAGRHDGEPRERFAFCGDEPRPAVASPD